MDQAREALGEPDKVSGASGAGMRWDWWTYNSGWKLRFTNAQLESWTQSEPTEPGGPPAGLASAAGTPASAGAASNRKLIYSDLKSALKRAEIMAKDVKSNTDQRPILEQALTEQVRTKYGITAAEGKAILAEGDSRKWPTVGLLFQFRQRRHPGRRQHVYAGHLDAATGVLRPAVPCPALRGLRPHVRHSGARGRGEGGEQRHLV